MSRATELPPGISRIPGGAYRARIYDADGRRRHVGTFRTVEAAVVARDRALGIKIDTSGRTSRSDSRWAHFTAARIRNIDPEDREVVEAVLEALERRAARRFTDEASTEECDT